MLNISFINYLLPLWAFLLILVVLFAVLLKTAIIGENKSTLFIISFIVALIFISFTQVREYLVTLVPWIATLLIAVFFIFLLIMFIAKEPDTFTKPLTWIIMILFAIIILVVAFNVFPEFYHLLPKTSNAYLNSPLRAFKRWLYTKRIINSVIFIIATAIVGFVITRK